MLTLTNTHILVHEFEYLEPRTVEEAVAALAAHGEQARVMAGGTDLLVQMKMERRHPAGVISLGRVAGLARIGQERGLVLGTAATIRAIAAAPVVQRDYAALAEACRAFSTVQIMEMATIGGNVCNASPAADSAPALLVFDAVARLVSAGGGRDVPLTAFFTGPGRTVLRPGELLESLRMPAPAAGTGSAFLKIARVAADIAKVCVAVRLVRDGAGVRECRIALGAVAPTPVRAPGAERVLLEGPLTTRAVEEAARRAQDEIRPITDVRSTAAYRRQVAGVLVRDALARAWTRAGGGEIQ